MLNMNQFLLSSFSRMFFFLFFFYSYQTTSFFIKHVKVTIYCLASDIIGTLTFLSNLYFGKYFIVYEKATMHYKYTVKTDLQL